MEEQPRAPPSCINDIFPPEIMQKIFQRLESTDLFQSVNVCNYWQDVITEHNEVDLQIGGKNRHIWKDYNGPPFLPIEAMGKYRTMRAFISKLENPKEELPPIQTEFWRKPDLLHYLWIDGYLRKGTFNNILNGLYNLQKLEIHYNVLTSFDTADISVLSFQSLVNLKDFSIRIFSRGLNRFKNRRNGFVNAIGIFNSAKFPNLEHINLSFPSPPIHPPLFSELIRSISYFMIESKSTLKGFKLFIGNYGGGGEMLHLLPPRTQFPLMAVQDLNLLRLKSIEIHSVYPYFVDEFSQWMFDFVDGQRNLEVIHLTAQYLFFDEIQQLVPSYSTTIKVIQLTVDTIMEPFDLNVFSMCTHLKKLELKGTDRRRGDGLVHYRIQAGDVDLIGGRLIPKTLESLIFINLYISTQDMTEILQDQINLKSLRCVYIGMVENFGVSVDTFIRLISERNVEKIFLRNSINSENVIDGFQPNEVGGLKITSILSHKNKKHEQEISLCLDGENYKQSDEEPYGQLFPDGRNFPNFVMHEGEAIITDEFHEETPNNYILPARNHGEDSDD